MKLWVGKKGVFTKLNCVGLKNSIEMETIKIIIIEKAIFFLKLAMRGLMNGKSINTIKTPKKKYKMK
jgi:hypothetical protein